MHNYEHGSSIMVLMMHGFIELFVDNSFDNYDDDDGGWFRFVSLGLVYCCYSCCWNVWWWRRWWDNSFDDYDDDDDGGNKQLDE